MIWILVVTQTTTDKSAKNIALWSRIMRFLRILKIARNLRKTVLASRTRYNKDGYSLELGYVTPTCIAMALPAIGAEANYLNRIEEVQRFFSDKHGAHYLIFNCCAEREYDKRLFGGRVETVAVENHNPPMLDQLLGFLEHAASFLDKASNLLLPVAASFRAVCLAQCNLTLGARGRIHPMSLQCTPRRVRAALA